MRKPSLAEAAQVRAALSSGAARQARVAAKVSQAEMARRLGVSRSAVWEWESGRCLPTAEHAVAYGRTLAALAPAA